MQPLTTTAHTAAAGGKMLLALKDIHKRFPGVHALKGVSFDLEPGEVHALVGENGAGKTTLMLILAGVCHPDSGSISLDGHPELVIQNERHAQAPGRGREGTVAYSSSLITEG